MRHPLSAAVLVVATTAASVPGQPAATPPPSPAAPAPQPSAAAPAWTLPPEAAAAFPAKAAALEALMRAKGAGSPEVAKALRSIAQGLVEQGKPALARPLLERALAIDEKTLGPEDPGIAKRLVGLASVIGDAGDPGAALPLLERALAIDEKALGPEHQQVADVLELLTVERYRLADLPGARDAAARSLAIREKTLGPEDPLVARSLSHLGLALQGLGDYAAARTNLERAVALLEKKLGRDDPELAPALTNLANFFAALGDAPAARPLYDRVLRLREKAFGPDHPEVAAALDNLASLLFEHGDLVTARPLLERALAIEEKTIGPHAVQYAYTSSNLAVLLRNQGDLVAARALFERATRVLEQAEGSAHPDVAQSLSNQAGLMADLGENAAAVALNDRAIAALEQALGSDNPAVAEALLNGAELALEAGNPAKAMALAARGITLAQAAFGASSPMVGRALTLRGRIAEMQGEPNAARADIKRSIEVLSRTLGADHLEVAAAVDAMALLDWRRHRNRPARAGILRAAGIFSTNTSRVLPFLAFAEQRAFIDANVPLQTALLLSSHRGGTALRRAYGLLFRWKGLLIDALRRESALARLAHDPTLAATADRLAELRARLAGLYQQAGSRPAEAWRREYQRLTAEKEAVERELARAAAPGAFGDRLATLDLRSFLALLQPGEAFVDVYRYDCWNRGKEGPAHYAAIVSGPTRGPVLVDLGGADVIDTAARRWRVEVLEGGLAVTQWQALGALVWRPIAAALPAGTDKVWLSPDGELARVPWHLLPATEAGTREVLVAQTDSARELARLVATRSPGSAAGGTLFLAGAIDFDAGASAAGTTRSGGFEPLPGTAAEVASVRDLGEHVGLATIVASGQGADKAAVKAALVRADFAHLATHGFFFAERPRAGASRRSAGESASEPAGGGRNPLVESGIAVTGANRRDSSTQEAEGLLTAEELIGVDLSRCRLLTLSACETGRGEEVTGQGVLGLRAACLAAGARSLVMSLWTVPDESTARLMRAFYANLWERRLPAVEALRRAQESVRDDPSGRFREPIHWEGWALAGEGW
jgi:CHAT domain-containing protein/tetratricopeptide (TPR) repeat protein